MNPKHKSFRTYRTEKILGVKVDFVPLPEIIKRLEKLVKYNKHGQITTPNPEHIVISQYDYRFKKILNQSTLSIPDGIGVVWAVRILQHQFFSKKFQQLNGIDLMLSLLRLAALKKWRVFLLGGKNSVAENATRKLKNENKKLQINYFSGALDIQNETLTERRQAIWRINKFKPQLLFVAYGAPMQEKWIADNLAKLKVNVGMGVGGAFDFLSGKVLRAPKIVQRLNLEWLWRLCHQPWRWRRQLRLIKFVFLVVKELLVKLFRRLVFRTRMKFGTAQEIQNPKFPCSEK